MKRVLWLGPLVLCAQVGAPRIGCLEEQGRAFDILGVAGSFVLSATEACEPVPNPWRIVGEDGALWLERVDPASGAVEHRQRLEPGSYGVWADGSLAAFDTMALPGAVAEWRVVHADWMLLRIAGQRVLLARTGEWFYLAGAAE